MTTGSSATQNHKFFCSSPSANEAKTLSSQILNELFMIKFFQIVFLTASVILIVINVLEFNKWREGKKEGSTKPHPIKWLPFILTSLVAIGCALNIIIGWISKA